MRTRIGFALLLSISFAPPASAAIDPASARHAAWDRLAAASGAGWSVRWDGKAGVPASIRGRAGAPALEGWSLDRARAVESFFDRNPGVFGLRAGIDVMVVRDRSEHLGIVHLRVEQQYRGIPVIGGEYKVSVAEGGDLRLALGNFVPGISADITPGITPDRAAGIALEDLKVAATSVRITNAPAILRTAAGDRLVHSVELLGRGMPIAWRVLVDAHTAEILERLDLVEHANPGANVYLTDPSIDPQDLPLYRLAGDGTLSGTFVQTRNVSGADYTSLEGEFHLDPSDRGHFDQANAYWHVDHFIGDFLGALGYGGVPGGRVTVYVGGLISPGQPVASTTQSEVTLSYLNSPEYGHDAAQASDIIYHETQHAVTNGFGIAYGNASNPQAHALETRALNEATSDYFAAAATGDPHVGEWIFGGEADNVQNDPAEYNYSNYTNLNSGLNGVYAAGEIWSGALWDIRTAIGVDADRIAFEALAYLPSQPGFLVAADAVRQADWDHHGGTHLADIDAAFARRGIGSCDPEVTISGPDHLLPNQRGDYGALTQCGYPPLEYQWSRCRHVDPDGCEWETMGTTSTQAASDLSSFDIRCVVTDGYGRRDTATEYVSVAYPPPPDPGPPSVMLTGPESLAPDVAWPFTATVTGGAPPFKFHWSRLSECERNPLKGFVCDCTQTTLADFLFIRGASSTLTTSYAVDFSIAINVEDAQGRRAASIVPVPVDGSAECFPTSPPRALPGRVVPVVLKTGGAIVRRPQASVQLEVHGTQQVKLAVYDLAGREVARLADGVFGPGTRTLDWNVSSVPSGVYFYRLAVGAKVQLQRIVVFR